MEIKIGFKTFVGGDNHIAIYQGRQYEYFHFEDMTQYSTYLDSIKSLKKHGINIPKVIAKSKKNLVIIREYIESEDCLHLLEKDNIDEKIIEQLFLMYRNCRIYKFDLDYMPENYKYYKGKLYYLSIDMFKKNEQYALETFALPYWMYSKEGCKHLIDNGLTIPKNKMSDAECKKSSVLLTIKYW